MDCLYTLVSPHSKLAEIPQFVQMREIFDKMLQLVFPSLYIKYSYQKAYCHKYPCVMIKNYTIQKVQVALSFYVSTSKS